MSSPQDEAVGILKSVLTDLFNGTADIKNVLRRCAHVCQILSWSEQLSWFQNELNGYSSDTELPWYRKGIKGHTIWRTCGGLHTTIASVVEDKRKTKREPTTCITMDVWVGIDWILSAAQSGYVESTGKKSSRYLRTLEEKVETEEVRVYDKQIFQGILKNIENPVFNFASKSYSVLCYGDAMQDVWQAYRTKVDQHLVAIGLGGHLDTVRTGLNSNNPQDWRAAMWSCRDILHDLAAYLWQDSRDTYEHLPGKGKGGKLGVTQSNYVNRLGAYLYEKGVTGETGAYIRAEMERIYHSIQTLNKLDGKAHNVIALSDIRTAAIGTYIILGELVMRTDMKPVTEYHSP
ncbi:hypothetical protein ES703_102677 [subsurface metagenome]